jgi:diguanylate cyclase (GGDEF)-like protein
LEFLASPADSRQVGLFVLDTRQRKMALTFALLGTGVPIAIAVASNWSDLTTEFVVGSVIATLAPLVVTLVPRDRSRVFFYLAAFGGLPALTLLQAHTGGPASSYSILLMMAMVWFGLQASDRELVAGMIVLAACAFGPMLVIGPPAYPVSWGHAAILVFVGLTVSGSLRMLARETRRLTTQLREQATLDALTGLLNRRGWDEAAEREMARSIRDGIRVSVAMLDLDRFKQINDTMGHDEGDRVLVETADRMRLSLRTGDVLARLGGDEFVALFCDTEPDEVLGAVTRLRRSTPDDAGFSAGFAAWDGTETLSELLRRADIALYAAKISDSGDVEIAPRRIDATPPD